MRQKKEPNETVADEEAIGTEGRGGLFCRVQADGASRGSVRQHHVELRPGSCIRVSVGARRVRGKTVKKVARLLAFVDPITGKLVIRMGMYDISTSTKGHEDGPQIVDVSDAPVCDIDTPEE